jgi:hypothetical protein
MIADAAEEMADEPIYDKQIVEIYRAMIDASPTFSASPAAPTPAEGEGVFVSRKLIGEAHAVMRACGWHLAPGSELQSDGVIEAAAAEIEEQFCGLLSTPAEGE